MAVYQPRFVAPDSTTDRGKVWRVAETGSGDANEFTDLVHVAVLSAAPTSGDDGKTLVYNHSTGTFDFAPGSVDDADLYYKIQFWS